MTEINAGCHVRWFSLDSLLLVLVVVIAFLLGCYELEDSDIWWHLRGGAWILEHGWPDIDPFTFGSADRHWVDIHWSYQLLLTLAYQTGGIAAVVLFGAIGGAVAVCVALLAYRRRCPAIVSTLVWLPCLVLLSFRLDPRPEIFSLIYLSGYLVVLLRMGGRPQLVWWLVPLQILWVNVQGLFILGPILLGMLLADRAIRMLWPSNNTDNWSRREWKHAGLGSMAVCAACLFNPYGLAGALFPFDLFAKVADRTNLYKLEIDELKSPHDYAWSKDMAMAVAETHWPLVALEFLLLLIPLSFLWPALWQAYDNSRAKRNTRMASRGPDKPLFPWITSLLLGTGLLLAYSILPWKERASSDVIGLIVDLIPWVVIVVSGVVAILFGGMSRSFSALVLMGGISEGLWMSWLRTGLLNGDRGICGGSGNSDLFSVALIVSVGVLSLMLIRLRSSIFRIFVFYAFTWLSLQAIQNSSRFAIVAGILLTANFGEWALERGPMLGNGSRRLPFVTAALALCLLLWIGALVTDRYYVNSGEARHFGLGEKPHEFAHDMTRQSAQAGLPPRALVYDLGQASVYTFHNAPRAKAYLDGRLEMPSEDTFRTWVTIRQHWQRQEPGWEPLIANLRDPVVLLGHPNHFAAEAALLENRDWRCIAYDPVASMFLHRSAMKSETQFAPVSFAERHFGTRFVTPQDSVAALLQAKALYNLATALPRSPASTWRSRIPVVWTALDALEAADSEGKKSAEIWFLLGSCYWYLAPDLLSDPPSKVDVASLRDTIYWAQATYCLRNALEIEPGNRFAWRTLIGAYSARKLLDAQVFAAERYLACERPIAFDEQPELERTKKMILTERDRPLSDANAVIGRIDALLDQGFPTTAMELLTTVAQELEWPRAERYAKVLLHLGRPESARKLLQQSRSDPSASLKKIWLGSSFWAEQHFDAAVEQFQEAIADQSESGNAWWGLAMLHAQRGDSSAAAEACRRGLQTTQNHAQRGDLESLQAVLESLE